MIMTMILYTPSCTIGTVAFLSFPFLSRSLSVFLEILCYVFLDFSVSFSFSLLAAPLLHTNFKYGNKSPGTRHQEKKKATKKTKNKNATKMMFPAPMPL